MTVTEIEKTLCNDSASWLIPVSTVHCPFIKKMRTPPTATVYREVTVRVPTAETDRFGNLKPQRRRFDLMALVKPHYKAWGSELFALGIEIKVTKSDLVNDKKFVDYLAYCDYFAFCVPTNLVLEAKKKISAHPKIGILNGDTGAWEKLPDLNAITDKCGFELYRQISEMRDFASV